MGNFKCFIATLKRSRFILCLLGSLFFFQTSFATDYVWTWEALSSSSPSSTCELARKRIEKDYGNETVVDELKKESVTSYKCVLYTAGNRVYNNAYIYRSGDSCPSGSNYHEDTGLCDEKPKNPCDDAKGASKSGYWTGTYPGANPPNSACLNGCEATYSGVMACGNTIKGLYGCTGTITVTGNQCQASNSLPSASEQKDTSKWPTSESSNNDCTWKTDANGYKVCQSKYIESRTGETKCGQSNGSWVCTEQPKATSTEKVTEQKQNTVTNSDGSTTTTTTSNTTTTTCKGVGNNCTSSTSTSTTSEGKDSNGNPTGSSSTCTGSNCKSDGKDEKSNEGNKEEGDEEEKDEGSASGFECEKPIQCDGDALQCAIIQQQKLQRCADEAYRKIDNDKLKESVMAEVSGDDFQPIKATAENTFDLSSWLNTSSRFSGSCPILPSWNMTSVDGSPFTVDLSSIQAICTILTFAGYIIVAFAIRRACEIVAEGM